MVGSLAIAFTESCGRFPLILRKMTVSQYLHARHACTFLVLCVLEKELEKFLDALPGSPSLSNVTPKDICRFLVYKDQNGKTQVHKNGCVYLGQQRVHECGCPLRLSHKTVDSYIGKLRSIFHALGRDGEWDRRLCLGNPAANKSL